MNPSIVIYVIGMLTIFMTTMLVTANVNLKASPTLNADWTLKSILLMKEIFNVREIQEIEISELWLSPPQAKWFI